MYGTFKDLDETGSEWSKTSGPERMLALTMNSLMFLPLAALIGSKAMAWTREPNLATKQRQMLKNIFERDRLEFKKAISQNPKLLKNLPNEFDTAYKEWTQSIQEYGEVRVQLAQAHEVIEGIKFAKTPAELKLLDVANKRIEGLNVRLQGLKDNVTASTRAYNETMGKMMGVKSEKGSIGVDDPLVREDMEYLSRRAIQDMDTIAEQIVHPRDIKTIKADIDKAAREILGKGPKEKLNLQDLTLEINRPHYLDQLYSELNYARLAQVDRLYQNSIRAEALMKQIKAATTPEMKAKFQKQLDEIHTGNNVIKESLFKPAGKSPLGHEQVVVPGIKEPIDAEIAPYIDRLNKIKGLETRYSDIGGSKGQNGAYITGAAKTKAALNNIKNTLKRLGFVEKTEIMEFIEPTTGKIQRIKTKAFFKYDTQGNQIAYAITDYSKKLAIRKEAGHFEEWGIYTKDKSGLNEVIEPFISDLEGNNSPLKTPLQEKFLDIQAKNIEVKRQFFEGIEKTTFTPKDVIKTENFPGTKEIKLKLRQEYTGATERLKYIKQRFLDRIEDLSAKERANKAFADLENAMVKNDAAGIKTASDTIFKESPAVRERLNSYLEKIKKAAADREEAFQKWSESKNIKDKATLDNVNKQLEGILKDAVDETKKAPGLAPEQATGIPDNILDKADQILKKSEDEFRSDVLEEVDRLLTETKEDADFNATIKDIERELKVENEIRAQQEKAQDSSGRVGALKNLCKVKSFRIPLTWLI